MPNSRTESLRDMVDFLCLTAGRPLPRQRLLTTLYLADRQALVERGYNPTDDDYRNDDGTVFGVATADYLAARADDTGLLHASEGAAIGELGTMSRYKERLLTSVHELVQSTSDDDVARFATNTAEFPESALRGDIALLKLCETIGVSDAQDIVDHIEDSRAIRRSFAAMETVSP